MADDGNATALEWANKGEFLADEAIRQYQLGAFEKGDELFRASSNALEKASAAFAE